MKEQLQKEQFNSKTKNQRENKMKAAISFTLAMMTAILSFTFSSCSESPVNSLSQNDKLLGTTPLKITAAGENKPVKDFDSTRIQLDLNLRFKSENIAASKLLESNIGNTFNQIVSFSRDLKPGEIFDLQELETHGIFALYVSSTGIFTLYNSDGMAFRSKTVLMEKCSFIDLKLKNEEQKIIKVSGFVAGE